jgi:hypothetical protein
MCVCAKHHALMAERENGDKFSYTYILDLRTKRS